MICFGVRLIVCAGLSLFGFINSVDYFDSLLLFDCCGSTHVLGCFLVISVFGFVILVLIGDCLGLMLAMLFGCIGICCCLLVGMSFRLICWDVWWFGLFCYVVV